MNADRRKEIDQAAAMLEEALSLINMIAGDEQESFNNMPESLQESDRGNASEQAIGELEDAASTVQDTIDQLMNAKDGS